MVPVLVLVLVRVLVLGMGIAVSAVSRPAWTRRRAISPLGQPRPTWSATPPGCPKTPRSWVPGPGFRALRGPGSPWWPAPGRRTPAPPSPNQDAARSQAIYSRQSHVQHLEVGGGGEDGEDGGGELLAFSGHCD